MEHLGNGSRRTQRIATGHPRALTRRHVVGGAFGIAGAAAIGAGLARPGGFAEFDARAAAAQEDTALCEPVVWASENGLLQVELTAGNDLTRGPGGVAYGGGGLVCESGDGGFGGKLPGPTLLLYPGDRLKLKLKNRLTGFFNVTNIHVHGLHVSPIGSSDNVYVHIDSGDDFDFEYQLPDNHPSGLFWYHPHFHGHSAVQVNAGLAGAIIIAENANEPRSLAERLLDVGARYPGPAITRERLLVLQQLSPPPATAPTGLLVNGQSRPAIGIRRNEQQRWRILNASASRFFNLRVVGHQLRRIAVDGNWIPNYGDFPAVDVLALGPAERAEVLITGSSDDAASAFEVRSLLKRVDGTARTDTPFFDHDLAGLTDAEMVAGVDYQLLATLIIENGLANQPEPPPVTSSAIPRASTTSAAARVVAFAPPGTLRVDGQRFNHGRIDQTVPLGATETWRIVNEHMATDGWHPFHIHVNDFDVLGTSASGGRLEPPFYQDTIPLPPNGAAGPGWVEFSTTYADFPGKFVYHCHFLNHEDAGMMGAVEVVTPVQISGSGFVPDAITTDCGPTVIPAENAGTTIVWTNLDIVEHSITADAIDSITGQPLFDSGDLAHGRSFAHTFDAPGVVGYHCRAHPGETGSVVVVARRTVEILDSQFEPSAVESAAGTTVTWTNRDTVEHSIMAAELDPESGEPLFASGPLAHRESFSHTFATPGTFTYRDEFDSQMEGAVLVAPVTRRSVSIGISDGGFALPTTTIPSHSTVTWQNRSSRSHTITGDAGPTVPASFDSGTLAPEQPFGDGQPLNPGQRFTHRFDQPGTVNYFSMLAMSGTITVKADAPVGAVPVEIGESGFTPSDVEIGPGSTITWTNTSATVQSIAPERGTLPAEQTLAPGASFSQLFPATLARTITYFSKHALRGWIEVV